MTAQVQDAEQYQQTLKQQKEIAESMAKLAHLEAISKTNSPPPMTPMAVAT